MPKEEMMQTAAILPLAQIADNAGGHLSDLPLTAHLPIALALVAGFLLWLVGGRLIKPAFATLGFVVGGMLGFLLLPIVAPQNILELPSPYAGMIFGGLSGLIVAIVVFRLALGIASAGALALMGMLCGLAFVQFQPISHADDATANALATDAGTIDTPALDALRRTIAD